MTRPSVFQTDDTEGLQQRRRFLDEVEISIRSANREIIHEKVPRFTRDSFFRVAVSVARLRASYLLAVTTMDWQCASETGIRDIGRLRTMYEEAREGLVALEHAIEVGYVDIVEDAIPMPPPPPEPQE
ncbi:hypothetical protein HEQ60_08950 [Haematospirillum sp. H1815]|uniref:hypothetical protein n=1 Tax=Haematospirillum sp. H1815 TaxID=2723108 RepID=UPI00143C9689|nr:hypothetical protein [Haematospirillum sp. H1815]NKD77883.1 hypothetical protein [Haematospirillum sp. H1815]